MSTGEHEEGVEHQRNRCGRGACDALGGAGCGTDDRRASPLESQSPDMIAHAGTAAAAGDGHNVTRPSRSLYESNRARVENAHAKSVISVARTLFVDTEVRERLRRPYVTFGSAGIHGIYMLGALKLLYETPRQWKTWALGRSGFGGVSIGALFATAFSAGADLLELIDVFADMDLAAEISRDRASFSVADAFGGRTCGIHAGHSLVYISACIMERFLGNVNMTFAEHAGVFCDGGDVDVDDSGGDGDGDRRVGVDPDKPGAASHRDRTRRPDLRIVATRCTDMTPVIFCAANTPRVRIIDALRASMSIPILYSPHDINHIAFMDGAIVNQSGFGIFAEPETLSVILQAHETFDRKMQDTSQINGFSNVLWLAYRGNTIAQLRYQLQCCNVADSSIMWVGADAESLPAQLRGLLLRSVARKRSRSSRTRRSAARDRAPPCGEGARALSAAETTHQASSATTLDPDPTHELDDFDMSEAEARGGDKTPLLASSQLSLTNFMNFDKVLGNPHVLNECASVGEAHAIFEIESRWAIALLLVVEIATRARAPCSTL